MQAAPGTMNGFAALSLTKLVVVYNNMVEKAAKAGLEGFKPVNKFTDKPKALKRCEDLQAKLTAVKPNAPTPTNAAFKRLQATGHAEEMRQKVLADQKAALENALNAKKPLDKTEDINGVPAFLKRAPDTEAAARAVTKTFSPDREIRNPNPKDAPAIPPATKREGPARPGSLKGIIQILVKENPRRKGTCAHAAFRLYKEGMRTGEYFKAFAAAKLGDPKRARRKLRQDVVTGMIKIV